MSRNVLLICDQFPPEPRVGALRPGMFAKYLPRFGWKPYVLTRQHGDTPQEGAMVFPGLPPEENITRVPLTFEEEKEAARAHGWREALGRIWEPEAYYPAGLLARMAPALEKILRETSIHAIVASSPTDVPLRLADMARRARGIPWVADFRDIVEQDLDRADGWLRQLGRRRWIARRGRLLRTCSAVVTVSPSHARRLAAKTRQPVEVLFNGFDPELWEGIAPPRTIPRFRIVYMGRLLSAYYRNPGPFFEALDRFLADPRVNPTDVEVLFYGTEPDILERWLAGRRSRNVVRVPARISYMEVPRVLVSACVALVLTNRGREGILTAKVFDALAARRPILCVPGDGADLDALLAETRAGVSLGEPEVVRTQLRAWYDEWRATGNVAWSGRDEEVRKYSRREQTARLAEILNGIAASSRQTPEAGRRS